MTTADRRANFVIIGENVHTTRVILKRGKRYLSGENGGIEGVRFTDASGAERLLPIPAAARKSQDYEEGRIKHVMIAVRAAMASDATGLDYLRSLVDAQARAGAHYLDVNVDEISIHMAERQAAMAWMVAAMREMSPLPISVDSSDVEVIATGLAAYGKDGARPLLNSASLERLGALDMAIEHGCRVVVTAAGESGMPSGVEERLANASRMVEAASAKGIALADMFIDPLFFPVAVDSAFGPHSLGAIAALRERFGPEVHITGGVSNASFGIPARKLINDVFVILATEAGLDSGIVDPTLSPLDQVFAIDRDSDDYRLAEDVILGRDEHCRAYIAAWRAKQRDARRAAKAG